MPDYIEYLQSLIAEENRNLQLIAERKATFVERSAVPLDLIRDEQDHQKRLKELHDLLQNAPSATINENDVSSLSNKAKIKKIYVDRDEERKLFREMIFDQTTIHILLMEADKGMGKTQLLDQFWKISEGFKRARVDFKHSSYSMGDILREMCDQYGHQSFSMFYDVCCGELHELGQDVKLTELIWSAMDVKLLQLPTIDVRKGHQKLITDAFLANLENIRDKEQPIIMLFDTFEKASSPTKEWITEHLINAIRRYPRLICVITGHEVPRITTEDDDWCLQHKLQPLSEEHSIEYIQKVKITQNEELVTFITKHSKGNPLVLQQLVQTLLEV